MICFPFLAVGLAGGDRGQDRFAEGVVARLREEQLGGRGVRDPGDRVHQQAAAAVQLETGASLHERSLPSRPDQELIIAISSKRSLLRRRRPVW
jgi:hypothetical protein